MSQPAWRFGPISGTVETAENLAADFGIGRDASDAFAVRSHHRAAGAQARGDLMPRSSRSSYRSGAVSLSSSLAMRVSDRIAALHLRPRSVP